MTKILIDEAAVKLVLDALEEAANILTSPMFGDAATALREALAEQPAQRRMTTDELDARLKTFGLSEHHRQIILTEQEEPEYLDGHVQCIGHAAQVFYAIRYESQHCDHCHAFERATDWWDEWHGGSIFLTPPHPPQPPQPAQRTWVGLSDEEKRQIFEREDYQGWLDYINAIEAKLKEKNNG